MNREAPQEVATEVEKILCIFLSGSYCLDLAYIVSTGIYEVIYKELKTYERMRDTLRDI